MSSLFEFFLQIKRMIVTEEPNWIIQILVGFVLASLLRWVIPALKWPFVYFRSHVLRRTWWNYHYSTIGDTTKVFESTIKIRSGFRGSLVFREDQQQTGLLYKGNVVLEKGAAQFLLIGSSADSANEENVIMRFHFPLGSNSQVITGISTSYDHNKNPYSTAAILSKERLDAKDAEVLLKKMNIDTEGLPLLRIRKNVS